MPVKTRLGHVLASQVISSKIKIDESYSGEPKIAPIIIVNRKVKS